MIPTTSARLTTDYVENEDRIRIVSQSPEGSVVITYLTRRLGDRLLPLLTDWLATSRDASLSRPLTAADCSSTESSSEDLGKAALNTAPTVTIAACYLVASIDLRFAVDSLVLVFKGLQHSERVSFTMTVHEVAQWYTILCAQYDRAGWRKPNDTQLASTKRSVPVDRPVVLH